MGLRCVSCRGARRSGQRSAGSGKLCTAGGGAVTGLASKEELDGWEGRDPGAGGRQSVSQSIGPGMKTVPAVSSVSQQTDCQFAEQWASRARVETGRGQGRWDAQGPGACLLACSCSCPLPRCSCRPSGEQVAAQGRAACPWGLGPAPGSWRADALEPVAPAAVSGPSTTKLSAPTKRQPWGLGRFI